MEYLFVGLVVILVLAAAIGRYVMLYWEMNHAKESAAKRRQRAQRDHERFEKELTPEAMRRGAR